MFTSKVDTQGLPVGHLKLTHMLDTDDPTLVDIPDLPPLMMDQSFFMPVSAIRSFFQTVSRVPFYRFPKTLGWPTMDVTLEPATSPASPSFSNLHSFLAILPNFFPPSVRALLSSYKTDDAHGPSHFYTSEAYAHLQQLNIRPGTSSLSMDMEYTWPVNWDIPDFTSILEPLFHALIALHTSKPPSITSVARPTLPPVPHLCALGVQSTLPLAAARHPLWPALRAHNPLRPRNLRSWENL